MECPCLERVKTDPAIVIDKEQEEALTYKIFTTVLQGLNDFRLFYPRLSFVYEIYEFTTPDDRVMLGEGDVQQPAI